MPITQVKRIIESDLDPNTYKALARDAKAIACATIAQVHRITIQGVEGEFVVKVQRPDSERLMRLDMSNMLMISKLMESVHLHLPFDHISVLLEYQKQVCANTSKYVRRIDHQNLKIPREFDFTRERMMMELLGDSLRSKFKNVHIPVSLSSASSSKVITMTYMKGESLAKAISCRSLLDVDTGALSIFAHSLVDIFGYQIFELGIFHSDPHPGNLLIAPSGDLTLLDFGQVKVLGSDTRIALAQLIIALEADVSDAGDYLSRLGIQLENANDYLKKTIAFILFDTRMDLQEATMNPFDDDIPEEIQKLRLSMIPQEVFMVIRTVALLRGILTALRFDIHSRRLWAPYAIRFLKKSNIAILANQSRKMSVVKGIIDPQEKMAEMVSWMSSHGLPVSREHLTPFALANVWTPHDLKNALATKGNHHTHRLLRHFSKEEQETICRLVKAGLY